MLPDDRNSYGLLLFFVVLTLVACAMIAGIALVEHAIIR
jgi:hypothetical protein